MHEIAHQLVELFLKALPTVFIVFVFYLILRTFFFGPLLKVMQERDARTRGAQKSAEAAQSAAAEKIKQYEDALKQGRAQLYAEQDAARRKLLDERNAELKAARARAAEEVRVAKERIGGELSAARSEVQAASGKLSDEIARRVLGTRPSAGPATGAR
ncbi:MAG: ATP synthase F0 subunit B [Acidobacteriia bacterium]|nr:ATP synthase F0 subunit B [Terriglobia bacterium]